MTTSNELPDLDFFKGEPMPEGQLAKVNELRADGWKPFLRKSDGSVVLYQPKLPGKLRRVPRGVPADDNTN